MSDILKGMTREQALGCLAMFHEQEAGAFVLNGVVYSCPHKIGLTGGCFGNKCAGCMRAHINAWFDEQEKPKWVEPIYTNSIAWPAAWNAKEFIYQERLEAEKEIARTNARREIEAFIRANGGGGDYFPAWNKEKSRFETVYNCVLVRVGSVSCVANELAEEVIRRFPAQLNLIGGIA